MRWRMQSDAKGLTPADVEEFQEWLAESEDHLEAYQSADRFCQALDALPQADLDSLGDQDTPTGTRAKRVAARWLRGAALAAAIAGVLAGTWWGIEATRPDLATATGEMRVVTLGDGSIIEMNTDTAVNVDLSPGQRRVALVSGEAFFRVAPDASRPFEVVIGSWHVTALGTAFNVRKSGSAVTVSVQEHAVRVSSEADALSREIPIGHQVNLSAEGIGSIHAYDETYQLAWRRHRLVVENQPLQEVIAELNRYRPGYIVPLDSSLQKLTVTAIFDTRNPEKALRTIESVLPVRLFRVTDRFVFVLPASAS